ncbi:MAG: Protein-export rane protein SecF [Rhodospirillales bacterium]|nr:Protein-export rane protein SecF [Rhodospirillales bacterium]
MRGLRLVPDGTKIRFMRGRFAGLIVSAVLSIGSIVLFLHPGLNYGIDFLGGLVVELRLPAPAPEGAVEAALKPLGLGEISLQQFGSPRDVLIRLGVHAGDEQARNRVRDALTGKFPGAEIRRMEVVGAKVSGELFHDGLIASLATFAAILIYIWFRFDWQFGVGVVTTLLLDATKTIGFFAVTRLQFDLNSLAAILILIGYSVTDKVVVYDRIRENLRKFKTMPLRELIDLSINQTLGRTVATSLTVLLSILPLAFMGGPSIQAFAVTIVFGIVVGTSSSIFIAAPILLFLGQHRLRPEAPAVAHAAGATG